MEINWNRTNTVNKDIHYFSCSNYVKDVRGGNCQTRHYIREDAIEQGVGKNRTQHIVIYYKFVGYIVLPDDLIKEMYTQAMRQGVEVTYIPNAVPA